jgi:hypothetical protein
MATKSPTQRTLEHCKKHGQPAYVTEKWVPGVNIRKDAFGFGDLLVIDGQPGSLLIQATVTDSMSKRITKIKEHCAEHAQAWLKAGNRLEVWGWAKRGAVGKRKLWTLKVTPLTLEDFS